MLGNRVSVVLINPSKIERGVLKKIDATGVYIYAQDHIVQMTDADVFFPMHRVVEVKDEGRYER